MLLARGPAHKISSEAECSDRIPEERTNIFFVSSIELNLKYAVGPSGKCTSVIASAQQGYSAAARGRD